MEKDEEDKSQMPMKTSRNKFLAHRHTKYSTSGEKIGKIKTSKKGKKKWKRKKR